MSDPFAPPGTGERPAPGPAVPSPRSTSDASGHPWGQPSGEPGGPPAPGPGPVTDTAPDAPEAEAADTAADAAEPGVPGTDGAVAPGAEAPGAEAPGAGAGVPGAAADPAAPVQGSRDAAVGGAPAAGAAPSPADPPADPVPGPRGAGHPAAGSSGAGPGAGEPAGGTGPFTTGRPSPVAPAPTGEFPAGPPSAASPGGGAPPGGAFSGGPFATGASPAGAFPAGPVPAGPFPTGPFPTGPFPAGPFPTGLHATGPYPAGPFTAYTAAGPAPTGLVPPGGRPVPSPRDLWPLAVIDPAVERRARQTAVFTVLAIVFLLVCTLGVPGAPRGLVGALPDLAGESGPGPRGHGGREGPGKGASGDEPAPATGTTAETVRTRAGAILDAHDRAVDTGDQAAALARLDPAVPAVRSAWQRLTGNLRKVAFADTRWRATSVYDVVPVTPGTTWPLTAKVKVRFEHRVDGLDRGAVVERYLWSVRCADQADACLVTAIEGAPNSDRDGPSGYPAPWDLWDMAVERRAHVLLMGPSSGAAALRQWADTAERAATYDLGAWRGSPGAPGFVMTLTRDRTAFGKLYTGESSQDWAAGYSIGLPAADPGGYVGAARIVIDLDDLSGGGDGARVLLRHEMAHALIEPLSRPGYDESAMWAIEGFADWFAEADSAVRRIGEVRYIDDLVRKGRFTGRLPSDADFQTDDEDRVGDAYTMAHLAVRYLADTRGAAAACAFIENVYGGQARGDVAAAIRTATGTDLPEFERAWAAWVRATFG